MKVLMVNGSPKSKGNTAAALAEVGAALEGHGIEWEVFQLGAAPCVIALVAASAPNSIARAYSMTTWSMS